MSKNKTTALLAAALLTVAACSSSTDTAPSTTAELDSPAPTTTAPSTTAEPSSPAPTTTAPSTTAAEYLQLMQALELTRCAVGDIITTAESAEQLSGNAELLGTAMAWDKFAGEAVAAAAAMSWPPELEEHADEIKEALAHEAATARQIVLGFSSDSSLLAGLQGLTKLYETHLFSHLAMRGKLSIGLPEPCSVLLGD